MNGNMVDEMKGADQGQLEAKVVQHKIDAVDSFGGKSNSLGE